MQAKDIPERPILEFLSRLGGQWATWGIGHSVPTVADAMPRDTPEKVQLAKMRRLMRRGLVDGCDCGCRGDFVITDTGRALISRPDDYVVDLSEDEQEEA